MALIKTDMLTFTEFSAKAIMLSRCAVILAAVAAPVSTAVCSFACVALLLTWLISGQALNTLRSSYRHPVGKVILLYCGWLLLGCFYADTPLAAKVTTMLSWQKLLFTFIVLGLFGDLWWKRNFVLVYVIIMTSLAILSIPLWMLEISLLDQPPGIILTNYVSQSTAFIAALLCCLFLLNQDLSLQHRIYIGLAALVFLFNIFSISPARSGYLALPPALLFTGMCFFKQNKLPHLLGFMALSLALAFMSSSTLQQRVKQGLQEQSNYQTSPSETSVGVRMIFYTNTWELIQKKPVFGYGTSAFASSYGAYAAAKYQDWRGHATTDPHNQYLFIWLENGLLGLLIFAAYVVSALRYGMRYGSYGYIAAGLLVAISVSSLFNSHFKTYPEGNLIAFFLGALLAHQYPVQKNTGKQHA